MGWFYGFKLHLISNEKRERLAIAVTPGNIADRKLLWRMPPEGWLHGSLYGTRGSISENLPEYLRKQGVNLAYKVRKNRGPLEVWGSEEILLKKGMLIEAVIRELKTQTRVEHTQHISFINVQVNVLSALIAYQLLESNPSLNFAELQQSNDFSGIL